MVLSDRQTFATAAWQAVQGKAPSDWIGRQAPKADTFAEVSLIFGIGLQFGRDSFDAPVMGWI